MYTAGLRAVLSCTHIKITIFRGTLKKKSRKIEKELRRKEKALAEAAALLILEKKAQAIWGDGGEG